jgi:TM2 domain-containing membrane protein YozV
MDENLHKQMIFAESRKSVGLAYVLWLFLGAFGVHRFYAGNTGSGIAQLLLALSIVGWLVLVPWLLIDLFLIPGMVRDRNLQTLSLMGQTPAPSGPVEPARRIPAPSPAEQRRQEMLEELRSTGYRKDRRDESLYR